ncbi:hypothetical protein ZIOFF_021843 [Zingiber officinale]|uniref:Uncharacterized protein n=1 Tax=Zingiber officinale TaxID=94328 RepID=A0A8J5H1Y6_ZINOF|nr:hypothetical protein ZIOFF_021843 [Zingiber officinale]
MCRITKLYTHSTTHADDVLNPGNELPGSMGGAPVILEVEELLAKLEMTFADIAEVFTRCDAKGECTNVTMNKVMEEMRR